MLDAAAIVNAVRIALAAGGLAPKAVPKPGAVFKRVPTHLQVANPLAVVTSAARMLAAQTVYVGSYMDQDDAGFNYADDQWWSGQREYGVVIREGVSARFLSGNVSEAEIAKGAARLAKYKRQIGDGLAEQLKTIGAKAGIDLVQVTPDGSLWISPGKYVDLKDVRSRWGIAGQLLKDSSGRYGLTIPPSQLDIAAQAFPKAAEQIEAAKPEIERVLREAQNARAAAAQGAQGPTPLPASPTALPGATGARPAPAAPPPVTPGGGWVEFGPGYAVQVQGRDAAIRVPWDNRFDGRNQIGGFLRAQGVTAAWDAGAQATRIPLPMVAKAAKIAEERDPIVAAMLRAATPTEDVVPPPSEEALKAARLMYRRLRHMMDPAAQNVDPDAQLREVAGLLAAIRYGDTAADLGAHGAFKLDTYDDTLRVRGGFFKNEAGMSWMRGGYASFEDPDQPARGKGTWWNKFPLKHLPAVARALDRQGLIVLALALRIAFIAEDNVRECEELDYLSVAPTIDAILDPTVRVKAAAVVARLRLADDPATGRPYKLYKFQEVGVAFAYFSKYRCLIGDTMGLGKTPQAIASLLLEPEKTLPALVVAPANVVWNWAATEIPKFAPQLNPLVWESTPGEGFEPVDLRRHPVVVISYDSLARAEETIAQMQRTGGFRTLIFDESHRIKNMAAQRTRSAMVLAQSIPNAILLSGTAMENRPIELFTQLHIIDPMAFPSEKDFAARYAPGATRTVTRRDGKTFTFNDKRGSANLGELRDQLRCVMIRRLVEDQDEVRLPDLARVNQLVVLNREQRHYYDETERSFIEFLSAGRRRAGGVKAARLFRALVDRGINPAEAEAQALADVNADPPNYEQAEMLAQMGALRQAIGAVKASAAIEWIRAFLGSRQNPKAIVFFEHQDVRNQIVAALTMMPGMALGSSAPAAAYRDEAGRAYAFGVIDGATPGKKRQAIVNAFQGGPLKLVIGSEAMREGLTLNKATDVLFVQRYWTPSREEQAEGRARRIGASAPVIRATYLVAADTIDQRLSAIVDEKRKVIREVMRGEEIEEDDARDTLSSGDGAVSQTLVQALLSQLSARVAAGAAGATVTRSDLAAGLARLAEADAERKASKKKPKK